MKAALLGVTLLVSLGFLSAASASVTLLPGGSTVAGKTIGQWTADWAIWANSAPVIDDQDGSVAEMNQSGPVFFVAGRGFGTVERRFNVPAGKYILLPLNQLADRQSGPGLFRYGHRSRRADHGDARSEQSLRNV
jgi:hypothetical protein